LLLVDKVSFSYRTAAGNGRRSAAGGAGQGRGEVAGAPGLREVSAEIPRGCIAGILGPNGSGKTTLLRLMAGTLRPTAGSVKIDGTDLRDLPRSVVARRVAVVPQETQLAFGYSVIEIVLMGRYPHLGAFQLEGPHDLAIARDALAATGTAHLERRGFSTLSGGEKQRVIIASALAQSADLMLLDEPTASLDLGYQIDVAALLARLNAERGVTLVIATHDLNFAAGLCRTVLLLREGGLLDAGDTGRVLTARAVRELYGVEADVRRHEGAGHLTVVPIGRAGST
jgi:iron complex transport system ATP-binding protein